MDNLSTRESFQAVSAISSSESFLSSLEVVINGRKNTEFVPYLQRTLSPLPVPLASFLFYALIYIHFHLLMLIIVLRMVVESHVMKMEKVHKFYERLKDCNINKDKILSVVKGIIEIPKNRYLSSQTIINEVCGESIIQKDSNTEIDNQFSSFPSITEVESIDSQDFHDTNSNIFNNSDYMEESNELIDINNTSFTNDSNKTIDIDEEV